MAKYKPTRKKADGTLEDVLFPVESIDGAAKDSGVVHISGTETISGTKTFSSNSTVFGNIASIGGTGNGKITIKGVSASRDYVDISLTQTNRPLVLQTGSADKRVGIGVAQPTEKLEVDGNAKATKFIGPLQGNADTATKASDADKLDGNDSSYYAADTNVVHKTGDETIGGDKTFVDNIILEGNIEFSNAYPSVQNGYIYVNAADDEHYLEVSNESVCLKDGIHNSHIGINSNGYVEMVALGGYSTVFCLDDAIYLDFNGNTGINLHNETISIWDAYSGNGINLYDAGIEFLDCYGNNLNVNDIARKTDMPQIIDLR